MIQNSLDVRRKSSVMYEVAMVNWIGSQNAPDGKYYLSSCQVQNTTVIYNTVFVIFVANSSLLLS